LLISSAALISQSHQIVSIVSVSSGNDTQEEEHHIVQNRHTG